MLVRKPVQIAVNVVVILLLVALIAGGIIMLLPVKGTMGTILGKMSSSDIPWPASSRGWIPFRSPGPLTTIPSSWPSCCP
ncbi:MAG: hypothetical protein PHS26_13515, partial [Actinomycetota bacterium]|nr:hypothetical protein [Actinomycetota bacterium]